ncbi:MAG: hypothetical protein ACE5JA_10490 [bacterium]
MNWDLMKAIYYSFFLAAILIIACFPKKIMRYLGLDPGRARDLFGYFGVAFLIVMLDSFVSKEWTSKDIGFFIAGVIVGIPITILGNHFSFRNIRDNVLGGEPLRKGPIIRTVVLSSCLVIGTLYTGFVRELAAMWWGACLSIITVLFIDVTRYEKKHGILYVKRKPDTSVQTH